MSVRRLHYTQKSGWCILLDLIPVIGSVIIFVFTVLDSTPVLINTDQIRKE